MKLGHSKNARFFTEEMKSKMLKIGTLVFFLGLLLLVTSFRVLPVMRIPIVYLNITFPLSIIMIGSGAVLVMLAKMFHGLSYILGLVVFLVVIGGMAHMQMQEHSPTEVERCCEFFVEEGGCTSYEIPDGFEVSVDGETVDCTELAPGRDIYNWISVCRC